MSDVKVDAKKDVNNQYHEKINGVLSFMGFRFVNGIRTVNSLEMALRACEIKGETHAKISDINEVYTIGLNDLKSLIEKMVLYGYNIWLEKINRYERIEESKSIEEIELIINEAWDVN